MKNLFQNSKKILGTALSAIAIVLVIAMTISMQNSKKKAGNFCITRDEIEISKLLEAREPNVVESNDDIDFKAFFLRDTDGDGYTEDMEEIDQEIGNTDYMFVEVNVQSAGKLKNGKIKINDSNFIWKTAILSNSIIKNNYIGDTSEIELNDLNSGTQILIYGKIRSKIGTNIHDFDKESLVTLTGTYVDDEENESELTKESTLKVNWNGTVSTSIPNSYSTVYNIENAIGEEEFTANFSVSVNETRGQLLMKKQEVQITIPQLNGFNPTSVTCTSGNVVQSYDEETRILSIEREAEVDENGKIISSVSRNNSYSIKAVYPIEAYESLGLETVLLNVPVTGTYYAYRGEKFGIAQSTASKTLSIVYKKIEQTVPVVREKDTWNFYTTVGAYTSKDGNYAYRISKENVQNLYDGNVYEDVTDTYKVCWQASVGQKEKINKITLEATSIDKFDNATSMEDYETTTGVYFDNAQNFLGNDGKIELYTAEGGLIETFTKDNWGYYSATNPYKINEKTIKVVTTAPVSNTYFYVYQIKELDDEKIVEDYTQSQFNGLSRIYTYAKGSIEVVEGQTSNTATIQNKSASALYEMPISRVSFSSSPAEIANHEIQNVTLTISTASSNEFEKKWKNGTFLVQLPDDIINADITSTTISNSDVTALSSLVYRENGIYYVRIDTENEDPATYSITLNLSVRANPLQSTKTGTFKLYASNKECEKYNTTTADIHDINNNGSTQDQVAYRTRTINLIASQGLITEEYITDYNDDENAMTISPNIAEIDRSDDTKTAKINVSIANNYTEAIDEITILGKIPYEGNKYVLNENNLGSEYTAHIKGAITVPAELQSYATVYYSTVENPTKDLTDVNNGWTQTVTDWTTVKSYLIDLGDYVLRNTGNKVFSYEVEVPARTGFNKAAFTTHAVYYCLNTEVGKYQTQTQAGKVGLQVVQKFNLELTKNKYNYNNILVPGATYKFTTQNANGENESRAATTGQDGSLTINGLYVGREYTLKEISSPSNYELNNNEIKFNTNIVDNSGTESLTFTTSGSLNGTPVVTTSANGDYLVKAKVQDEAKYTLLINTQDEQNNPLTDVRYAILGKNQGKMYRDNNNQVKAEGLYLNEEYQIQLMKSVGYYTDESPRTFTIVRDSNTKRLKIVTADTQLANAIIVEEIQGQSIVTISVKTEKIPTYNLQILKIEEPANEDAELVYLTGAQFKLTSDDTTETNVYTIDDASGTTIYNLYNYVKGKNSISGKYILQEIKAPEGYSNNAEEIIFHVRKNEDGLFAVIENESMVQTIYSSEIEDNTFKIIIQDKPLFKLTKEDSEQVDEYGNPLLLPNAKFVIWELDSNRNKKDFAKDVNGNYVGDFDEETEQYIVTTDENGQIKIPLRAGEYIIKEVGYPEGYFEESNIQAFKIYGDTGEQEYRTVEEIDYIEDLVDFSNSVNNGNTYTDKTVKLMRTLDFNSNDSYKNPNSAKYGDINGDGEIEDIKSELTTGGGFTPIGQSNTKTFRGTFDGQGYEIKNLYENNNSNYAGLFGYIYGGTIKNLGVSGNLINSSAANCYVGGLAGYIANSSVISNCYNRCNINSTGIEKSYAAGLIGYASGGSIKKCYNRGSVQGNATTDSYAGGIVGAISGTFVRACYNRGNITNSGKNSYAAGIIANTINNSNLVECCYTTGNISSSGTTSIASTITELGLGSTLSNCYYLSSITISGKTVKRVGTGKSASEMTGGNLLDLLGHQDWVADENNINDGFPILCSGNENQNEVVEINNIEDLVELSISVKAGENYSGKIIKLMRTLDFNDDSSYRGSTSNTYGDINTNGILEDIKTELTTGSGFEPIGNVGCRFSGTFEGNCYEINNIYINSNKMYAGLFGATDKATIRNLGVSGQISSSNSYSCYVGGISGTSRVSSYYNENCIISNCYNNATISSYATANNKQRNFCYAGGITGIGGNIIDCHNNANIFAKGTNDREKHNHTYAGGISGANAEIRRCYNTGDIRAENDSSVFYAGTECYAGGIVAEVWDYSVTDCYNTGNVVGSGSYVDLVGGITGSKSTYSSSYGRIKRCYNIGNVRGGDYVGAICGKGYQDGDSYYLDTINVTGHTIDTTGYSSTAENMKSLEMISTLGEAWVYDFYDTNDGFPILGKALTEESDTIKINYIEDLVDLQKKVSSETTYKGKNVKLIRSLDFSEDSSYRDATSKLYGDINGNGIVEEIKVELTTGRGFYPIGLCKYNKREFSGTFDGQGNEIKNLYMNRDSVYVGLFAYIKNAKIINLSISGNVTGTYSGNCYTGGIVAFSEEKNIIQNCCNKCTISGTTTGSASSSWTGGIIAVANTGSTEVSNCSNIGNVSGNCTANSSSNKNYTGGIVGNAIYTKISDCHNNGNVGGSGYLTYVGGISGLEGTINRCYSTGSVFCESITNGYAGGISGAGSVIRNCYNTGNIGKINTTAGNYYSGGICGMCEGSIMNCYNIGNVKNGYDNGETTSYTGRAGTIRGTSYDGEISRCYYLESINLNAAVETRYGTSKNEEEMTEGNLLDLLGRKNWKADEDNVNNGFPILNSGAEGDDEILEINSIEDLVELSEQVNIGNRYGGKTVKLMRSLDFNDDDSYLDALSKTYGDYNGDGIVDSIKVELTTGSGFKPIGENESMPFNGIFDGQGYEVNNLYINTTNEYIGLLGYYTGTQISNIGLSGRIMSTTGSSYIGSLVGYCSNSKCKIDNCYSNCYIEGGYYTGGIVGYIKGSEATISNCYNTGDIYVGGSSINRVGGIIGSINGANAVISNCYNTGNINTATSYYNIYIGGIIGDTQYSNKIEGCYNTGNLSGKTSKYCFVGGICSYAYGEISRCYNTGDITSDGGQYDSYSGGIIATTGSSATISNCYNTGNIVGNNSYNNSTESYVGGLAGNTQSGVTISNSYSIGDVKSTAYGNNAYVGGISGKSYSDDNTYYLSTIEKVGKIINSNGTEKSVSEMSSKEFFSTLNRDKVWQYNAGDYPTLSMIDDIPAEIDETTELTIRNTIKKFTISTEIVGSEGGTINGENEIVNYGENNSRAISIIPNQGYEIVKITINGKEIVFDVDSEGTYTIPENYFTNVIEDKKIVVTFGASDAIFTVNKVDEDDNNTKLEGAKFEITTDSRDFLENEIGKIVKNGTYYFEEVNGKYVSNNQNKEDTVANSYIPIDLSEKTGKYILKINAVVSSQAGADWAYITIRDDTTAPSYNSSSGRFVYISGLTQSKDYTTSLMGGNIYYIHLGYYKDSTLNWGTDTFTINNIEVIPDREGFYSEILTTNELGQVKTIVSGDTTIYTRELEAPDGYTKNKNTYEYTMVPGQNNEITVTNKKQTTITVHHYYKDTTNKVAEDEIIMGDIGQEYSTSPKDDLEKLSPVKDDQGNYVLPEYASGTYGEDREIVYYYEVEPVYLTIHHYLDGTDDKLADDEIIEHVSDIEFIGECEYRVSTEASYTLSSNESYNNLQNHYEFVRFVTPDDDDIRIDDTLEYSVDTDISYIYIGREYNYTVNYIYENGESTQLTSKEHYSGKVRTYTDGTITGYYFDRAEALNQNGDVVDLPLVIGDIEENNVINVYYKQIRENRSVESVINSYTDEEAEKYRVTYVLQKTVGGETTNCKDENDEDITITLTGNSSYIFEGLVSYEGEEKIVYSATIAKMEINLDGWKELETTNYQDTRQVVTETSEKHTINCIFKYTVNYYYENVKDESRTDVKTGNYKENIRSYTAKTKTGYTFDKVEVLNQDGDIVNLPLVIGEIEENNVINVYYKKIKENRTIQKTWGGLSNDEAEIYRSTFVLTKTVNGVKSNYKDENNEDVIITIVGNGSSSYEGLVSYEGDYRVTYRFEETKVEINQDGWKDLPADQYSKSVYNYSTSDQFTNTRVYTYTVHYFYEKFDGEYQEDISLMDSKTANYKSKINSYTSKYKTGFSFNKVEALNQSGEVISLPLVIGENSEYNVINVYYRMIRENHSVEKVWRDISSEEAEKYESTFVIQKTVNGVTSDCKDENDQDITGTVTGNGTYTFEGMPSYEGEYRITYSVKEVSVVKDSTTLISDNEHIAQYEKVSSTSDKVTGTLTTQYKVQKQWNISNQDESKNYKSTFVVLKTDGESEPVEVTDVYEIIKVNTVDEKGENEFSIINTFDTRAMGSVVGNGTITFENLPKYEDGKELTYSVEEVKIEITKDNGTTWTNRNIDTFVINYGTAEGVDKLVTNGRIFNITTKIETGVGTVTGEFNEDFPEENGIRFVESVNEGENGTTDIVIAPAAGHDILYITINGESYDYTLDSEGKVTIPKTYFTNVTCDYSIEMAFGDPSKSIKIIKTDEEGNRLEGAKFRISANDGGNGGQSGDLSYCIGEMTPYSGYYFELQEDGSYINNNQGVDSSAAVSYSTVDLSGLSGKYAFRLNAEVSSEENYDYGYIIISKVAPVEATSTSTSTENVPEAYATATAGSDLDEPHYMVRISGEHESQDYSVMLDGGETYYVYYVYGKDGSSESGSDTFTIRDISLTGTTVLTDQIEKYDEDSYYYFEDNYYGGYVSNNWGYYNSMAISKLEVDLSGQNGEYNLVINARLSSYEGYDWGYIVLSEDNPIEISTASATATPIYDSAFHGDSIRYIMRETGEIPDRDYITQIDGGSKYYVYFVYGKIDYGSSGYDQFTINSVTLESTSTGESAIVTTNANGEAFYEVSDYGTYTVMETKAPAHHIISNEAKEVEVVSTEKNQTVTFTNKAITYDITTEVGVNSIGTRAGGTISGEYTESYPSGNNKQFVESVKEAQDAKNDIVITPASGYKVGRIKINNKNYAFETEENGTVIIPKSKFTNVTKNQHVVVTFEEEEKTVTIITTDKVTGEPIEGAQYRITSNFERECNMDKYISEMHQDPYYDQYSFDYDESSGAYTSNNTYQSDSMAVGYKIVDLRSLEDSYDFIVNAKISSESGCDCGYVVVTEIEPSEDTTIESLDIGYDYMYNYNANEICYIYGEENSRDYTTTMYGGNIYIVYFVYYKDSSVNSGTDTFTINSMKLDGGTAPIVVETGLTDVEGKVTFNVTGYGEYTVEAITTPDGYIPMDDMTFELLASEDDQTLNIQIQPDGIFTATYTVNYIEKGTTTSIETSKTSDEVDVGSTITSADEAIDITGFTYDSADVDSITIGENSEENVINLYYTRLNNLSYTIHYREQGVDGDEGIIQTATTEENQVFGNTVNVTAPDIDGFEKVAPTSASIEITTGTNEYTFYYSRLNNLSYTIHYREQGVDGDEGIIQPATTENNQVFGNTVNVTAPDIDGFEKVAPTSASIEITTGTNEYTFYYSRLNNLSYTIHYREQGVDGDEGIIQTATTENNQVFGNTVNVTAPDIDGFEKVAPTSASIEITTGTNEYTFYYSRLNNLSYTIHYREQGVEGDEGIIQPATTENNQVFGNTVNVTAPEIDGFEKVAPTSASIEITTGTNEYTFYYSRLNNLSYTIHYREQGVEGDEGIIQPATTENNQVFGNTVNVTAPEIDGFERVAPTSASIEITTGTNEYTFYYSRLNNLTYTIHYREQGVDGDEGIIQTATTEENQVFGNTVNVTAPDIDGFEKVAPTSASIEITTGTNEYTFYYSRLNNLSYTIHYREQGVEGDEGIIQPATTENNQVFGNTVNVTAPEIDGFERVAPTSASIEITTGTNEYTFYYRRLNNLSYTIHHVLRARTRNIVYVRDDITVGGQTFGDTVTVNATHVTGYRAIAPTTAQILITTGTNEHTFYYEQDDFDYTVHYYYDGVEDEDAVETLSGMYKEVITEFEPKANGYVLAGVTPVDNETGELALEITSNPDDNRINVFYRTQYKVTTEVTKHTEVDKDGTVRNNVTGGSISGSGETSYENVFKGDNSTKDIVITPNTGYEITSIKLNDEPVEYEHLLDNGSVTLNTENGFFTNMDANKHVEVEFRKKSNVIVKYLEKDTNEVLATEDNIPGHEGGAFETARKSVSYYQAVNITDENNNVISSYDRVTSNDNLSATGTMYADTLTIIYWYERIPAGIIVKHIAINENDKQNLSMTSGTELDEETLSGYVSLSETTTRKTIDNYIAVDGPASSGNIIVVSADDNSKTVTYAEGVVKEVRYYYERQYKVTTESGEHGTISGEDDEVYELINDRGYNSNEIVITPDAGYRVKEIKINGEICPLTELSVNETTHVVTIPAGETDAYFTDVQEDKHVAVEFEKIPAKVIVKYKDIATDEEVIGVPEKVVNGYVGDEYNEPAVTVPGYTRAEATEEYPEPTNSHDYMTEADIEVVYWYIKQFTITVSAEEGGTNVIEGEVESEVVNRGGSNTLKITIGANSGYRLSGIEINDEAIDYANNPAIVVSEDSVEIPSGYFTNVQENIHVVARFERIQATVKVEFIDVDTEESIFVDENGNEYELIEGYVNQEYTAEPKNFDYYTLVEEKMPTNAEDVMTEDEITVKYYYRKLKFNMRMENEILNVVVNNEVMDDFSDTKNVEADIKYKDIDEVAIKVVYKIKVINDQEVAGTAVVEEHVPEGFEFVASESEGNWNLVDGVYVLTTDEILPGESKEYIVVLNWIASDKNYGSKKNISVLVTTENGAGYAETVTDDNKDEAIVKIVLNKEETMDKEVEVKVKGIDKEKPLPGIRKNGNKSTKTGDNAVYYLASMAIAGVIMVITIKKRQSF